ncbi:MAG: M20/M25/M40 family metallo-hydrolase [Myxococcota bacterium]
MNWQATLGVALGLVSGCSAEDTIACGAAWAGCPGPAASLAAFEFEAGQAEDVAKLSGAQEAAPGVVIGERTSEAGRAAARDYLLRRFEAIGLPGALQEIRSPADMTLTGANVMALLPATTSSETWIVVGAHFDTFEMAPGAADNATGVSLVLAAAEFAMGLPRRNDNIAFVLFDEEETGLNGSGRMLHAAQDEGWSIAAMYNTDMVAHDADGDRLVEVHTEDAGLAQAYRDASEHAGLAMPIHVGPGFSSDDFIFAREGIPSAALIEGFTTGDTTPHYHRETDTFEHVNLEYLATATRLTLQVLAERVDVQPEG